MKMKSSLRILAIVSALSISTSQGALVLSAIYDGFNSTPKGIEIYVTSTGSYSGWTVDIEFNANTSFTTSYAFDATSYTAGDYIYLTSTAADTNLPSAGPGIVIISDGSFNMNGDDRIRITDGTNVVDQFGVSATDGTGESWEYTDSYAVRKSTTTASGSFVESDWVIQPVNTTDSGNTGLSAALGTYTPVPEPSTALLGALGLLALFRRHVRH